MQPTRLPAPGAIGWPAEDEPPLPGAAAGGDPLPLLWDSGFDPLSGVAELDPLPLPLPGEAGYDPLLPEPEGLGLPSDPDDGALVGAAGIAVSPPPGATAAVAVGFSTKTVTVPGVAQAEQYTSVVVYPGRAVRDCSAMHGHASSIVLVLSAMPVGQTSWMTVA